MGTLSHSLATFPGHETVQEVDRLRSFFNLAASFLLVLGKATIWWIITIPLLLVLTLTLGVIYLYIVLRVLNATRQIRKTTKELNALKTDLLSQIKNGASPVELEDFMDLNAYVSIKKGQDSLVQSRRARLKLAGELEKVVEKLRGDDITEDTIKKVEKRFSWLNRLLSFLGKPFSKFNLRFSEYNKEIMDLLAIFDATSPKGKYFYTVPENELWENRNKAYEYLI